MKRGDMKYIQLCGSNEISDEYHYVVPFRFSKRRNKEITTTLNRSPGYDGITVKLYRQFWESLKDFIVPVFNYNYDRKELTQFQIIDQLHF